jgi:tetratricopeptide (TPR) repeat protein
VLSALGYKSDQTSNADGVAQVVAGLLAVGLLTAWLLMPQSESLAFVQPESTPPPAPPRVEVRAPKIEQPRNDPLSPILAPRTSALAAAAPPRTEVRDSRIEKPQSDPRTPILELRTRASAAPDEFQLALYHQRSGDFEQALMHYRAALQRDEMNVEAHNNLGNLYLGKGLFEEATREFQRVIAIDPKYLNARVNLSAAYTRLGRPDAAAAEARAALQIDGRNPDAMVNLSLAQRDAGLTADAQRSLRLALEIDPRNAAAHYNIARQFEAAGELTAAIAHYNHFIQYASPEQAAFVADVRVRVTALNARLK